ncbi:ABC transporter permease [Microbacterium aquimaris]|uniref:ABC transporter permease n=1 Tax=Microbacterium aquimaris TaxID=459816 RepID=A0ABU5N634_9MICO|nr:ABC transporter permease [Microbacterium aquimaris]MDZ8161505.1 ABC transporter permease [Microbacterium aquimaris]
MSGQSPESTSLGPGGSDPVLTRSAAGEAPSQTPVGDTPPPRQNQVIREILRGNIVTTLLAVVLAMLIGGVLVALTDPDVQAAAGYFFARPQDMIIAVWQSFAGAYSALFRGAIWNYEADTFVRAIKPITDTLNFATPLIAAGLGVGLAFRVGLFNIGARGQMLMGIAAAATVATTVQAPLLIHLPLTIAAGLVGGALWGGLVGFLKARTGAHEVILTIMLNFVAFYFVAWLLATPGLLQRPGGTQPISSPTPETAQFPSLFPAPLTVNWGFIVAIGATVFVWWLVERSSLGFRMRAVGENPFAARAAGVNVERIIFYAMAFAGALAGLAGVNQISGTITSGFGSGIDAGIGFDAITVALLGRSKAWGVFAAGILFGALKAGSFTMQVSEDIPVDIVVVVQALIVLFIAAPPLIRTIFFLPKDDSEVSPKRRARRAAKAGAA